MRLLFGMDRLPRSASPDDPRLPGCALTPWPLRLHTEPLPPDHAAAGQGSHAARLAAAEAWLMTGCGAYAPLRQRIGMRYRLGALSLEETIAYVEHRIRVAGAERNPFSREAMEEMHAVSGGVPRLINTLATTALLDAFGDDAAVIEPPRVVSAAREHRMAAPGT